jgi:hypothetical protein
MMELYLHSRKHLHGIASLIKSKDKNVVVWNGLIWLRIGTSGELL